jgi:hypothetical protein
VPPEAGRVKDEGESASGKDSMAGLINLLRRNVPRRDLLAACVAAWKKTVERGSGAGKDGIRNVETLLKAASDNQETPVRLYNRIVNMIKVNDSV